MRRLGIGLVDRGEDRVIFGAPRVESGDDISVTVGQRDIVVEAVRTGVGRPIEGGVSDLVAADRMVEGQRRPQDADPLPHANAELVGIGRLEIVRDDPELIRSRPGGIGGKLREECSETSRRQILRLELDRRAAEARQAILGEQDLAGAELPLEAFFGGVAEQRAVVIAAVSAEEDRALVGVDVVGKAKARREIIEISLAVPGRDIVVDVVERRLDQRALAKREQCLNGPRRGYETIVL